MGKLSIVIIALVCLQHFQAKPHRYHKRHVHHEKYKRATVETGGKKSDYYGYDNDGGGSHSNTHDDASQAFMDMSQPQGPYNSENHNHEISKTSAHFSTLSQKELDDAYNYVNNNHFGNEPPQGEYENAAPVKPDARQTSARSSMYSNPEDSYTNPQSYGDEFPQTSNFDEPVERLDPNDIEHNINLGAQSGTIQYNNPYNNNNFAAAGFPDEDGAKKSAVPSDIPANATHPPGNHTHLTETAIIHHHDNDSDYSGVSRYPPYITKDGKSVSGPPNKTNTAGGAAATYPIQQPVQVSSQQQSPITYPIQQPVQVPSQQPSPITYQQSVATRPAASAGQQQKVASPRNETKPESSTNSVDPIKMLTKVFPDISQLTSPGSDVGRFPYLPLAEGSKSAKSDRKNEATSSTGEPSMEKQGAPNGTGEDTLAKQPVVAKLGGGGDGAQTAGVSPNRKLSAYQYPVTLVNLGENAQGDLNNAKNNKGDKPQEKVLAQSVSDDARCVNYTLNICHQPWMQKHCPTMCKENKPSVNESDKVPVALPAVQSNNTIQDKAPLPTSKPRSVSQNGVTVVAPKPALQVSTNGTQIDSASKVPAALSKPGGTFPPSKPAAEVSGTCQLPSYGGNSNGGCCSVPYVYNGQPQYTCVYQPSLGYWCGTTPNYDQDGQWGYCGACLQPPCPPVTTIAPEIITTTASSGVKTTAVPVATTKKVPVVITSTAVPAITTTATGPVGTTTKKPMVSATTATPGITTKAGPVNTTKKMPVVSSTIAAPTGARINAEPKIVSDNRILPVGQGSVQQPATGEIGNKVESEAPGALPGKLPVSSSKPGYDKANTKVSGTCQLPSYGGNSNGACCSVPYVYNGQPQHTCVYQPSLGYWCSTTPNYDQDGQWGYCGACLQPPCPPVTTVAPEIITTTASSGVTTTAVPVATTKKVPVVITTTAGTVHTTTKKPIVVTTPNHTVITIPTSTPKITTTSGPVVTTPNNTVITIPTSTPKITTTSGPVVTTTPHGGKSKECDTWSSWSKCSASCDGGYQERHRTCHEDGSLYIEKETQVCNTQPCVYNNFCTQWTTWSNCSVECGYGVRTRFSDCFPDGVKETRNETKPCYLKDCEPVCDPWSNYTECSKTCGGGVQTHKRNCSITDNIHTDIIEVSATRACNLNPCPTEWSPWSPWSDCSVSCGKGYQRRWRKGSWEDLGQIITVPQYESKACNVDSCTAANCSEWSSWTECSKTCGGGIQERERTCQELDVIKLEKDTQVCNNVSCEPPFCGEWSAFTECTASCDGGIKLRWRTCGGEYTEENVTCNENPCNNLPYHTEWTEWSKCSAACGMGVQYRTRNVTITYNGTETFTASETESKVCYSGRTCEERPSTDCSDWSDWSECSATCNGIQSRIHHCKNETHESDELQARPCNTLPCPTQDSSCTLWSDWSECSVSCGGGSRQRYRTCENITQDVQFGVCNKQPCPETEIPISECIVAYISFDQFDEENKIIFDEGPFENHAKYDGDTSFITANFSCGNATKLGDGEIYFNGTTFKHIPRDGITISVWVYPDSLLHRQSLFSAVASGSAEDNYYLDLEAGKVRWIHTDLQGKTLFSVISDAVIADKDWAHIAVTYNSTTGIAEIFVNAQKISTTQGQGGQLVDNWDLFAGLAGPIYTERFHGLLDELYIYNCSLTVEQIRQVANTCRKNTGEGCPSPLLGVCPPCDNCNLVTTPTPPGSINGGWSEWSAWGLCSSTCGNGTKVKTRECNNPEPQNGGLDCYEQENFGSDTAEEWCKDRDCPINGGFCNWTDWSQCDKPCGLGNMTRSRECKCPEPQFGGLDCGNATVDTATCSLQSCPIHGNYTNWSPWSPCSKTCSTGSQRRARECANPAPKYGGNDCRNLGEELETQNCTNEIECPVSPNWTPWSPWSECSRSCGNGMIFRNRSCTNPPPSNGAPDCVGNATEGLACKVADCCNIPYKRLGCFKDINQTARPMPEMLFTDRDPDSKLYTGKPIHGLDFQGYVTDLICRCAKSSKEKKYTHFSIQDFGQCLSGPQVKDTYNKDGGEPSFIYRPKSRPWLGCMDVDHDECQADSLTCVGMEDTNFVYGLEDITPIDGNYTTWSNWSECSQSQGNGTQHRTRSCTNPRPSFGGANCSAIGPNTDLKECFIPNSVSCQWGQWAEYGECSESCGPGIQARQRNIAIPHSNGGEECFGEATSSRTCEIKECPIACGWSLWSQWTNCDTSCGEGKQVRERLPNNPEAAFGGQSCIGDDIEVQSCTSPLLCPINCGYTNWSAWSTCSKSCDGGMKQRTRNGTNPEAKYGGLDCISQNLGDPVETMECNTQCCQVNGSMSEWEAWQPCDVSCGTGTRFKTRKCDSPAPRCGGLDCVEALTESETCKAAVECPIPGNWGPWGNFSTCSKSCGFGGSQVRERLCNNPPPQFNGENCFGDPQETRSCDAELTCCTTPYRNLGCYNDLSTTPSSKPLPQLLFDDQDTIDFENWDDVLDDIVCKCAKKALELQYTHFAVQALGQCYSGPDVASTYDRYGPSTNCITTGGEPSKKDFQNCTGESKPCAGLDNTNYVYGLDVLPRHGNYTEWSKWSNCSVACGQGSQMRYRTCTNPMPAFGGKTCMEQNLGPNEETSVCNKDPCPIDCGWTNWTDWSQCSTTCGAGLSERMRSPTNPAAVHGGKNCTGEAIQSQPCNGPCCPVAGNFSEWEQWGSWSKSCGNATRLRRRTCSNPEPICEGKTCEGPYEDSQIQDLGDCPENGGWCEWSLWNACSKTCGLGETNRQRVCECPSQRGGGNPCIGPNEECKECNVAGCVVNGKYSLWTPWTACDRTCGNGTRSRSRSCSHPAPVFGGMSCIQQNLGESEETMFCKLQNCPVDGAWSSWSSWSACSMSCGEGRAKRERKCNNPSPLDDGANCDGPWNEERLCKLTECCDLEHESIGCFQDMPTGPKAFSEMLFTREDKIGLQRWKDILPALICDCTNATKAKGYTTFGLTKFGQCWSGATAGDTYFEHGESNQCISMVPLLGGIENEVRDESTSSVYPAPNAESYEPCFKGSLQCSGPVGSFYVYDVNPLSEGDGGYSEWGEWDECSKTCGGGSQTSSRTCTNPFPKYGGNDCTDLGDATRTQSCNENSCAVHGNWAGWTQWSSCSVTCGTGVIERSRNCSNPAPSENGGLCSTGTNGSQALTMKETTACNMPACPVSTATSAAIAQWGEWGTCSVTCGNGQKVRERNACPKLQTQGCFLGECPLDGAWGQWTDYTLCSKTCQGGIQNRTRACDSPAPKNNGKDCVGVSVTQRECNKNVLCPLNGNYTSWTEWEACDVTCGAGRQVRTRACTNPSPSNGGLTCIAQGFGNATESKECIESDCPVPCLWGAWAEWKNCSVTSGYGTQMRFRDILEGNCTTGDSNQTRNCFANSCNVPFQRLDCYQDKGVPRPLPIVLFNFSDTAHTRYNDWNSYLSELVCECAQKTRDAKYSHFALQDLGVCMSGPSVAETYNKDGSSTNCVSRISVPPSTANNSYLQCQADDLYCAGAEETSIFVYGLNVTAVDCGYTQWGAWDTCSKTCGEGVTNSERFDNNPPAAFGGKPCTEVLLKSQPCQIRPCPIPGGWGEWSAYGACSITCGKNGIKVRKRVCNNPEPKYDGAACAGDPQQNATCQLGDCPVNGGWSNWSPWGSCTKSCDGGTRERSRTCTNPAPVGTGIPCIGEKVVSEQCNTDPCIHPNGPWSNWTACNATCGTGYRSRSRTCPIPPCNGDLIEIGFCDTGISCVNECAEKIDLGFLVDFSNNVKGYFRDFTKPFILKVGAMFDISGDKTHFAYLTYSTVAGTNMEDNLFKNSIIDSLPSGDKSSQKDYMSYIVGEEVPVAGITMGHTFVNLGLRAAADHMFTPETGMRDNVKHVLVLISDGAQSTSTTPQETVKQAADAVRAKGVEIITIAIGAGVNENNLKDISNNNPAYVLRVNDYSDINSVIPALINLSCVAVTARWGEWNDWSMCSATCGGGITFRTRVCVGGKPGDGLCVPATANNETKNCNEAPCIALCEAAIDLGFLVDYSGSIQNAKEESAIKSLIVDSASTFDISKDNTHFAFIPFSTRPFLDRNNMFNNSIVSNIAARDKAAQLDYLNEIIKPDPEPLPDEMFVRGFTNTLLAADLANKTMFSVAWGMRTTVKKYLVMISDGNENIMAGSSIPWFDAMKSKGVEVIVVAVGTSLKWSTLKSYASKDSNIFNFTNYDAVKNKMSDIAKSICPNTVPSNNQPKWGEWTQWSVCPVTCGGGQKYRTRQCNGGNPGDGACTPASANKETETCNDQPCPTSIPKCEAIIDLGFIVDYSGSIQDTNEIPKIKSLVINTAMSFDVSRDKTHFAYIPFSTNPGDKPNQWFNNSIIKNIATGDTDAQTAYLTEVVQPDDGGGFSNTFRATKLASEKMFNEAWGMRKDVKKYLLIISDGKENIASPVPAKNYLETIKALGVEIIAVGVGDDVDNTTLQGYATKPENVFMFSNYDAVKDKMTEIAKSLCPEDGIVIDNPIGNDAVITTTPATHYHCPRAIDIVLVVDGSSSIIPYWKEVKLFLKNIVSRFVVNGTHSNFAIVLYSSEPKRELDLNGNKMLVETIIDMMEPLKGGTRIDKVLEFVASSVLAEGHNDRPDVPDVVVLLTDGASDKGSRNLSESSQKLKDHNVHVIAVGLGNETKLEELRKIATNTKSVFVVEDYSRIAHHIDSLAEEICEEMPSNLHTNATSFNTTNSTNASTTSGYGKTVVEHIGYTCEPTLVYSFDTVCDRTVYDESGKGNDGTAMGEFDFDEKTSKCKAKMLVSDDGAVVVNGVTVRGKPVDGVTIATWLNLYGDGKIHPVFSVINSKKQGQYLLEVRPQGSVYFSIKFGDKVVTQVTTVDDVFKFSEWTHLGVTYSLAENKAVIYINGKALDASKIHTTSDRESELLPGDWEGFVAIGKETLNSNDKQLAGGVDEFYMFPCILQEADIEKIKEFCSRHEPRIRSYGGTKYELFDRPASASVGDLQKEIESKNATSVRYLDLFEAPAFDEQASTTIGTGAFAAKLSGYFIPPISADYTFKLTSNEEGALYMNAEKPTLHTEAKSQVTTKAAAKQDASQTHVASLKAGVRYYIELYQLSKDKSSTLKLGFDVKCEKSKSVILSESPVTKVNIVYDIPRNCSEVRNNIANAPDDEYTLKLHSKCHTVNIYCRNMAGTDPKNTAVEYLTLNKGPEENYAKFHRPRLTTFSSCSGPENPTPKESEKNWGETWFQRVRVNPSNMAIQRNDYTYAYIQGNKMPYGSAGDCYSKSTEDCRKGQFKINLNGTDMRVLGNPTWVPGGAPADMKERITQFKNKDGKIISAHCGGSCSKCQPQGELRLQPDICLADVDSSSVTSATGGKKRKQKRNKRSLWSWWPW